MALDTISGEDSVLADVAVGYLDKLGLTVESAAEFTQTARPLQEYERTAEVDKVLKADLLALFPKLEAMMNPFKADLSLKAKDAFSVFDAALEAVGLKDKGWSAYMIPDSAVKASSNLLSKQVTWGEHRADFDIWKRVETPVHEAFHSVRSQNGSEQKDRLLHKPQNSSRAFEEAFVDAMAQLVSGRRPVIGKQHYLNQGLLYGLDRFDSDGQKLVRTARDVLELELLQKTLETKDKISKAELLESVRPDIYRATARGGPDATDLAYFEGCRIVNPWLNWLAQLPAEARLKTLQWVLSGVFDPTNPKDVAKFGGYPTSQNYINLHNIQ